MQSMPKQATGIIVHSVKRVMNKYCRRKSKELTDLISSADCPNSAKKVIDQCYATVIDEFQGAIHGEEKLRIPYMCW